MRDRRGENMPLVNATGYWDVADYKSTPLYTAELPGEETDMSQQERSILRRLAERVFQSYGCCEPLERKGIIVTGCAKGAFVKYPPLPSFRGKLTKACAA